MNVKPTKNMIGSNEHNGVHPEASFRVQLFWIIFLAEGCESLVSPFLDYFALRVSMVFFCNTGYPWLFPLILFTFLSVSQWLLILLLS